MLSMEKSQYKISGSFKREETIWVCSKCKKEQMTMILLGKWKLIGRSDGITIPCDVCGAGLSSIDIVKPIPTTTYRSSTYSA